MYLQGAHSLKFNQVSKHVFIHLRIQFMLKNISELIVTYQCSKFIVNHMLITWLQDFTSGDVVIQVRANDSDSGVNAEIDYSITGVCFW